MADGARHSIGYIAESVYGTTPSNPALQLIRNTSVSLALGKDGLKSEEIRPDYQIYDFRQGAYKIQGDVGIEMSYGTYDGILAGLLAGAWDGDVLKAGITRSSFTFERKFADLADYPYQRFTGCEISKMSLTMANNAIVKGSFSVLGQSMSIGATALSGSSYPAATTDHVFDAFTGSIDEGGSSIAVVTEVQLEIDAGLAPRYVVGSKYSLRPSRGWFDITGTATCYFENITMLGKFVNENESSLTVTLLDVDGNSLEIELPRIKYTGAPPDVKGIGPITLAMPFQALLSTGDSSNIIITRNPV